jgi:Domain of unknown function (DUF397)
MSGLVRDTGWFMSGHSSASNDACVEVRITNQGVGVRDSKNAAGPKVWVTGPAWTEFLTRLSSGSDEA